MNEEQKIKAIRSARFILGFVMLVALTIAVTTLTICITRVTAMNRELGAIEQRMSELNARYEEYEALGQANNNELESGDFWDYQETIEEHNQLLDEYKRGQKLRSIRVFVWCIVFGASLACFATMLLKFVKISKKASAWKNDRKMRGVAVTETAATETVSTVAGTQNADNEIETLRKLKRMLEEGLITQEDYDAKKSALLEKL